MTRDLNNLDILSERIAARIRAIPFDDGPHFSGVILCGLEAGDLHEGRVHGTIYYAMEGAPGHTPFYNLLASDLNGLNARDIARQLHTTGAFNYYDGTAMLQWQAGMMPKDPVDLHEGADHFAGIGWGMPWDGTDLVADVTRGLTGQSHEHYHVPYPGLAYSGAARLLGPTVESARRRFTSLISPAYMEAMSFMREVLPVYDPRVLSALMKDDEGHVRTFARRYPLLAMRSLTNPDVAAHAAAGDHGTALELSLRPDLVGEWILTHWRRHPKSANAVDGTRRGIWVDSAVDCFEFIPRDHLPMSPQEFAACVDICNWAREIKPIACFNRYPPSLGSTLPRARGKWRDAVASTKRVAEDLAENPVNRGLPEVAWNATASFRWDLLQPAMLIARGPAGLLRLQLAVDGRSDRYFEIMTQGMGIPDQARMLQAYLQARPSIAAADRKHATCEKVTGLLTGIPWLSLGSVEVMPICIDAGRLSRNPDEVRCSPGTLPLWLLVPAAAPTGNITVWFQARRPDGAPTDRFDRDSRSSTEIPDGACAFPNTTAALAALLAFIGVKDKAELGRRLVAMAGLEEPIRDLSETYRAKAEVGLSDMLKAWKSGLPRRFRGMDVQTFAEKVTVEYESLLPA